MHVSISICIWTYIIDAINNYIHKKHIVRRIVLSIWGKSNIMVTINIIFSGEDMQTESELKAG